MDRDKGPQTVLSTKEMIHMLKLMIREMSETAVTSLYLVLLITLTTNVHVGRKRGCAKSTFLKRPIRVRTSSHERGQNTSRLA
jgi:hypothetical protein